MLLVVLLGGACSGGGGDDGVEPTVPPGGTSSTTSTSVVSYDVPAVIDLAYVQRVVSAYDHALGDAIRVLVRDRSLSDEFLQYLVGLYTPAEFETQQRAWQEEVAAGRIERSADPVGDPLTRATLLARADATCVIARVDRDYSPTLKPDVSQTKPQHDHYLVLVRKAAGRDPLGINVTPWKVAFDGSKNDNSVPTNSCAD